VKSRILNVKCGMCVIVITSLAKEKEKKYDKGLWVKRSNLAVKNDWSYRI